MSNAVASGLGLLIPLQDDEDFGSTWGEHFRLKCWSLGLPRQRLAKRFKAYRKFLGVQHFLKEETMEYRSFADLSETIFLNAFKIPADVDLVVGIPRSGLLAANLVALTLNLPLIDLEGFLAGRGPEFGRTVRATMKVSAEGKRQTVLIVDDSILSGESMRDVRARVALERPDADAIYCAIYDAGRRHPEIDLSFETVTHPRMFQWNLMRHNRLGNACFDIDGVLCHDPNKSQNDDGDRYVEFLLTARPLLIPRVRIKHLVTSRLERYRAETEQWLKGRGIEYERLWMLDLPSAEERRRQGAHSTFKAEIYRDSGACIFVESEDRQAQEIASLSGLPVLSIEGQRVVWGIDADGRTRPRRGKLPVSILSRIKRKAGRLLFVTN